MHSNGPAFKVAKLRATYPGAPATSIQNVTYIKRYLVSPQEILEALVGGIASSRETGNKLPNFCHSGLISEAFSEASFILEAMALLLRVTAQHQTRYLQLSYG